MWSSPARASRDSAYDAKRTPGGGGILIWATETPFVYEQGRAVAEYEFKKPFYEALGRDTFRSAAQRRGAAGERVLSHAVHER